MQHQSAIDICVAPYADDKKSEEQLKTMQTKQATVQM
jgi:hypothetical protein